MKEIDKKRIKAFKKEYEAYLLYSDLIIECENKLEELERMVGVHSPNLEGVHHAGMDRDKKLVRYTELKSPILAKLARYRNEIERVDKILIYLEEPFKTVLKLTFTGKATYESLANKFYMSKTSLQYNTDTAILRAINSVDKTMQE